MWEQVVNPEQVGRRDGENVIIHQSWWNQLPLLIACVLFEVFAIFVSVRYPDLTSLELDVGAQTILVSILPPLPLLFLARAAFKIANERVVVTPSYLIHVIGRLSWREHSVRLEYEHIQEIETVESIWQRMLGLGDLIITPLGGIGKAEIRILGLANPRAVKDLIRETRSRVPADA